MVRLVLLGASGSGRTTQAKHLRALLNIPVISTSEILRSEMAAGTDLGLEVKSFIDAGEFVPDPLIISLMRSRLNKEDTRHGWILEGYPRTSFQAEELDFLLDELGCPINHAIYLEASEETLMHRSRSRGNADDTIDVIQKRIEQFLDLTMPLLEYYGYKQKLLTVNSEHDVATVSFQIEHGINHLLK
ncbi:adenylate kinase family protein [Pseudanabaena yagii]|uniref:Adenylate kinase n=1 Tax=Pseudanabaena yagii GIHE-NHR1 TaxID=2722753 RepID=A0ABX1LTR2_9CYAN|nr:nucleoside monophosphate kinase [Pseudanabaena yagii]NMF58425.1 nucleoside monophosphate kinase [Pseudanabaena yagii GIHE-NHR1]